MESNVDKLLLRQNLEKTQLFAQPLINQTVVQEDEELNLRQVLSVIKHRLSLIAAITISMTAAACVWTFMKTPVYQGKFFLLIGKPIEDSKSIVQQQEILDKLGGEEIDYDTQIEVLISPQLLNPVIKKVALKYPEIEYQELIKKKGKSPLVISQRKKTKILEVSYDDQNPKKIKFVLENLASAYMGYSSQGRKTELNQGLDLITEQLPLVRQRVARLQQQMQQLRQNYKFIDPEKEATRLSEQFEETEKQYVQAEVALNEANSRYQILQKQVGLDPNQAIIATYLSESPGYQDLLKQLQAVEIELAKQSALYSDNNPLIQTLQEKRELLLPLLHQEAQRALGNKLSETVVNNSPSLVSESQLRLKLTQQLVEAANERETLQIKVQSLGQAIDAHKGQVKQFASLARQYTDLHRELEVNTTSLNRFLEEQQKLQLKVAQQVVPWQIIALPQVEDEPVSPRPVRNIGLGVIGGLLLGLGAAFLAERLDPVYHSTDDLKEETKLPILGAIPWQKDLNTIEKVLVTSLTQLKVGDRTLSFNFSESSKPARTGYYAFSAFSEAFRSLNTNIRLLGSDTSVQSLVVSSVRAQEGKTTISINFAKAAAAMGQRVLLVDADLRRPQIHPRLELPNEIGLSSVIATGVDLRKAIQPLPQYENLFILTAGEIPPDPTRLLSSKRMQALMAQLEQDNSFDLIIYDAPPSSGFADARILAALTTGMILVTKIAKTDRFALKNLIEELKLSQISILGLIANNVSRKEHHYYYYNYSRYGNSKNA